MEIKRFFLNKEAFDGKEFVVNGEEFYHMTKVLRHKVGYKIIVCLNDGYDYYATISSIGKDSLIALLDEKVLNDTKTKCDITLMQALPKGDKFDFIVQKSVELGVGNIIPFTSQYTNETKINLDRSNRIILEACKQCGRNRISNLHSLVDFNELIDKLDNYDLILMAYEKEQNLVLSNHLEKIENSDKIAIIVGSEGGFSQEEYEKLKEKNVATFSLGKRILRAETASIAVVTLVMYLKGEMNI